MRQVFLPLGNPIEVEPGETLKFSLKRPEYGKWTWTTESGNQVQRQSTFLAGPLTPDRLLRSSDAFQPRLSSRGKAADYLLSRFDGSISSAALADDLLVNFSDSFSSREDALRFVKSLIDKFA